jgi:hypothetical protein
MPLGGRGGGSSLPDSVFAGPPVAACISGNQLFWMTIRGNFAA